MIVQRIKEYGGYDPQTKKIVTYWKVFFLDTNNQLQTKIVTDLKDLEALVARAKQEWEAAE